MSRPTAIKNSSLFSLAYAVSHPICATPERLWAVLTNAADYPKWNSTVSQLDGTIALGERLALKVPLAPGRTFNPKVTALEPNHHMEWSDGMAPMFKGVRTFRLEPSADGTTLFTMTEQFSGLMLPLIRGSLPDFTAAFEQFAVDLATAAERS